MLTKILVALLMGFLFSSFDFDYDVAARNEQVAHTVRHVVEEGETLWSIGERYYDGTRPFDEGCANCEPTTVSPLAVGASICTPAKSWLLRRRGGTQNDCT